MSNELEHLRSTCEKCHACPLGNTRTNLVFGVGNPNADLMFVGEAPGEREDETGIPFVGAAGQLLDKYLIAVGLERENVYIANILKCRPPRNRDPLPEEGDACIGFLREQVKLIRPKIIVCLGRIAAMKLIREDYRISREHGQWVEKGGIWFTAMYHPSALLRDPSKRSETFRDLKMLQAKVHELCQTPQRYTPAE